MNTKKKLQTFVLRVWERSEGTRYELRMLTGERKTFRKLEDAESYIQTLQVEEK
jgi:hypothetical protein